jgi:hypothetical protein
MGLWTTDADALGSYTSFMKDNTLVPALSNCLNILAVALIHRGITVIKDGGRSLKERDRRLFAPSASFIQARQKIPSCEPSAQRPSMTILIRLVGCLAPSAIVGYDKVSYTLFRLAKVVPNSSTRFKQQMHRPEDVARVSDRIP